MSNFIIGAFSGSFATSIIQPIDFLKVQIQLNSQKGGAASLSPFKVAKQVYSEYKSFTIFYKGLDAAILRQIVYTGTRLGLFYTLTDSYQNAYHHAPNALLKSILSLGAGALGSFVANPVDLALVRLQADSNLPIAQRNNYKNVIDAVIRIAKEEKIPTLWRGSFPTVVRAMAMNFSLLVPFEEAKKFLEGYVQNTQLRSIGASLIAGCCASFLSLPFDNAKTKLQSMKKNADGKFPYRGIFDVVTKTVTKEGALKMWVGLPTFYVRVAPHVIISLVSNDFLRGMLAKKRKN